MVVKKSGKSYRNQFSGKRPWSNWAGVVKDLAQSWWAGLLVCLGYIRRLRPAGRHLWSRWRRRPARTSLQVSQPPRRFWRRLLWRLHPKRVLRFIFSWAGLRLFFIVGLSLGLILFLVSLFLYNHYRADLPANIVELQDCIQGRTTRYYDKTNTVLLWASKSDVDCRPIRSLNPDQVSPHLVTAVLVAEDQNFYNHRGFHEQAIIRAAINNLRGQPIQGGSTITQQYVKNAILKDRDRSFSRKVRELILAFELERNFTKEEILTAYLNVVSFGSIYDGIDSAARGYFDKSPSELTVAESALLAAAIPAPSYYWANPDQHLVRQKSILKMMANQGHLSQTEYDQAAAVDIMAAVIRSRDQYDQIIAPHFVLEVEKRLKVDYGPNIRLQGLRVVTTLDVAAQDLAEKAVAAVIPSIEKRGFDNAAAVAVETQTGKVIAEVGSRDFDYPDFGQINTVTTARDPGSVFKIFSYGALIEDHDRWGAGSTLYDYQTTFVQPIGTQPGYTPNNYNKKFDGPITIRRAFGRSLNIPAIKAMYITGKDRVHQFAEAAGIKTPPDCGGFCGLSTAIGGGVAIRLDETANAYATFGRGGIYRPLTYIDKVYDQQGRLIYQWRPQSERAVSAETAYIINDILSDESVRYSQRFNLDNIVAGVKTGTTDDFKNNSILAYTPAVSFGAWLGHHDITKTFGESYTTEPKSIILRQFMEPYHAKLGAGQTSGWSAPAGIQKARVNLQTGYVIADGVSDQSADETDLSGSAVDIYPSWYKLTTQPPAEEAIVIDKVSGKLATQCTPPAARQLWFRQNQVRAEIAPSDPAYGDWMEPINQALGVVGQGQVDGTDDVHDCDDELPQIRISTPDLCHLECSLLVTVTAGTHAPERVNLLIDGVLVDWRDSRQSSGVEQIEFQYEPAATSESLLVRVDVIDAGLYQASDTIRLATQANTFDWRLDPVIVDRAAQTARLSWNFNGPNLMIGFDNACLGRASVEVGPKSRSELIYIGDFRTGLCTVYLSDSVSGQSSNSQSFWVDFTGIGRADD